MNMQHIKDTVIIVGSALLGFFHPISDFLIAILILLLVNFASGLLEDELDGTGWKGKKAWKAFTELFIITGIAFFVFALGHFMHSEQMAVQCLSVICYAAIYFYCRNILNNWLKIVPKDTTLYRFLLFLNYLIGLYFLDRVPGLKAYFKRDAGKGEDQAEGTAVDNDKQQ